MKKLIAIAALTGGLLVPATADAGMKRCFTDAQGSRVSAGENTSCGVARKLHRKLGGASYHLIEDGQRVKVRSPSTGQRYAFFLWQADERGFIAHSWGDGRGSLNVRFRYPRWT